MVFHQRDQICDLNVLNSIAIKRISFEKSKRIAKNQPLFCCKANFGNLSVNFEKFNLNVQSNSIRKCHTRHFIFYKCTKNNTVCVARLLNFITAQAKQNPTRLISTLYQKSQYTFLLSQPKINVKQIGRISTKICGIINLQKNCYKKNSYALLRKISRLMV